MNQYYDMDDISLKVGRIYQTKNHLKKKYKILKSNKKTGITEYYDYWDKAVRIGSRLQFIFDIAHRRIVLLKKSATSSNKSEHRHKTRHEKSLDAVDGHLKRKNRHRAVKKHVARRARRA